jgi:hypothetical protein
MLVMLHGVVQILGFCSRIVEPSSSPCQLVAIIRALVILLATGYRLVIKAAIGIGESVQILRVLQTLGAILGVDVPEDDARGRESGCRFAGEIGT